MRDTLDLPAILTPADWAVFVSVLLATFAMVIYGQTRKRRDMDEAASFLDLMVMGRRLTLPMFVATLVATWYGGIFGVTQIAFDKGVYNFLTQGVFWYATYALFALFIVGRLRRYDVLTLPEMVGRMFGPRSEKLAAVFNFMNVIPIVYAISLGLFLQALFGGSLPLWIAAGVLGVVLYSFSGGLRAVVFSDMLQFFVMCAAVFLVLAASVARFGGLGYLRAHLPASHFAPLGGESWATALVWGFIALSTLVDPNFYQRCFAADSERTARRGIWLCLLVWVGFDICTTAGAMYARAAIPGADSAQAYLIYAVQILPSGLRGFFLAGILATILSTLDSYIFLAGTTLAYDLVPARLKGKVKIHHLGVVSVGVLAVLLSFCFEGNIKEVWKTLGSYSAACLLFPVLYGHLFPGRLSDLRFVATCLAGVAAVTYWRLAGHAGFWAQVDDLYAGVAVTSLCLLCFHLVQAEQPKC
ncbi:MAG: sodium:solute symporter family protein [Elusimicrobiota bacterium]